jgi:hypothetical protein
MARVYSLANTTLQQVSTSFNTSAPKTGQAVYGNLLKLMESKCFLIELFTVFMLNPIDPCGSWVL